MSPNSQPTSGLGLDTSSVKYTPAVMDAASVFWDITGVDYGQGYYVGAPQPVGEVLLAT